MEHTLKLSLVIPEKAKEFILVVDENKKSCVTFFDNDEEGRANAKLIAQAPELLSQLDELVEVLNKLLASHRTMSFNYEYSLLDTPIEKEANTLLNKITTKP